MIQYVSQKISRHLARSIYLAISFVLAVCHSSHGIWEASHWCKQRPSLSSGIVRIREKQLRTISYQHTIVEVLWDMSFVTQSLSVLVNVLAKYRCIIIFYRRTHDSDLWTGMVCATPSYHVLVAYLGNTKLLWNGDKTFLHFAKKNRSRYVGIHTYDTVHTSNPHTLSWCVNQSAPCTSNNDWSPSTTLKSLLLFRIDSNI